MSRVVLEVKELFQLDPFGGIFNSLSFVWKFQVGQIVGVVRGERGGEFDGFDAPNYYSRREKEREWDHWNTRGKSFKTSCQLAPGKPEAP